MFKKAKSNGLGNRTVFSNTHEQKYIQVKKFAATFEVDGETKLVTTEGKFRSEAVAQFKSMAKSIQAKFDGKIYPVN
jgi:hypothetical protein